jgi:hypothetical protein
VIIAPVLPNISSILVGPATAIHGTVLSQCRLAIQRQDVCVEELASLDWAAVAGGVGKVVHILSVTGRGTETCIERTGGKDFGAHISVVAQSIVGCVDGCIAKVSGVGVARWSSNSLVHVAIGASNHNRELHPSSAGVIGGVCSDRTTPVYTPDIV